MTIFGTRPEAIKMAPVVKALQAHPDIQPITVVTGQHREMLDQVLQLFDIVPDVDLNIMQAGQSLFDISRRALEGLEPCLQQHPADLVLVQGDTTTAFISGLAAFYLKIPVGHVEAGLRTNNRYEPFPEEINRRLLSTLCELNFAPTEESRANLLHDGIRPESIYVTGNTVTDALQVMVGAMPAGLPSNLVDMQGNPVRLPADCRLILVETHRRENLGKPMEEICEALRSLVKSFTNLVLVFSVHRNPRVREVVLPALEGVERVRLLEPVDYPVLLRLMRESHFILTDSGGIQEEAPSLGKPVLVLRRTTERPEGIRAGVARLVGTDGQEIVRQASGLLVEPEAYREMSQVANPYGDGKAAQRTVQAILHRFLPGARRPEEFVSARCSSGGCRPDASREGDLPGAAVAAVGRSAPAGLSG
ncbi:MAG: UDP-N-acetylglucosamine 2-epimerase (non-hydrolyzing) [Armatimonadetes bacterium]|nr:UDP-N-acetylglucosamine 2-epimerase (non-hydrolyzing) [Armatimonadota bacterium]